MSEIRLYLGIDTSNYTSSCAIYNPETDSFDSKKQLLPVEFGKMGLRQSDAVFHHTHNLPPLLSELTGKYSSYIVSVGCSVSPRDSEESYMPCFLVGKGYADVLSSALNAKKYYFSHQAGHIAAALWSSGQTNLIGHEFIAFHVSGGTTDVLLVKPDREKVFSIEMIASSLDLKAGQAVDRVGGMLGLPFPSGAELDVLAAKSDKTYKIKPYEKDGSCSFSGLENQCAAMLKRNENQCDIAKYCIDYIYSAIKIMTLAAIKKCGNLPLIYAGGVMSNSIISERLTNEFGGHFASPYYSSDNAAGIAYLGYIKSIE